MNHTTRLNAIIVFFTMLLLPAQLFAQKSPAKGSVQRIKVHGKLLEGNLSHDSPDRFVSVYLPASYQSNTSKRYPVVYFLHGYTDEGGFAGFGDHAAADAKSALVKKLAFLKPAMVRMVSASR
jgi:hypothetical protein